jgi:hypothetical protein
MMWDNSVNKVSGYKPDSQGFDTVQEHAMLLSPPCPASYLMGFSVTLSSEVKELKDEAE